MTIREAPAVQQGRHRADARGRAVNGAGEIGDSETPRRTARPRARSVGPTVTVVICAYTERRWDDLVRAVRSVHGQTHPVHEIIVVIDYCPALLQRAAKQLRGVTVRANRHRKGLSGARNTGIAGAAGTVVAFLDDDAVAEPTWIAELLSHYRNPRVVGVGGRVSANWLEGRPPWFPIEFDWVVGCSYLGQPTGTAPVRNFIGANMSLRRDVLVQSGGFHTDLGRIANRPLGCEETELCIRVARSHPGAAQIYEPAAGVLHSVPGERGTWSYFRSRCYAEGVSKAVVKRLVGSRQALSAERSYLSSTVPRGFLRYLAGGLSGRLWDFAAAFALVFGVAATVLGYLRGTAQNAWTALREAVRGIGVGRLRTGLACYGGVPLALALWAAALPRVDLSRIGDYGLIPLLPNTFWLALAVLLISFGLLVRRPETPTALLFAHIATLIAILHVTPSALYGSLRYSWAWKHVGVVDFFLRHDSVDTTVRELSVYQYWPGFFNVNAMLDRAIGLDTSLGYAAWAPPFFNALLVGPLLLIFRTFTDDRRLIWSAVAIYFLGAWVGQDYFSPQACVYFLYLTLIGLVLRYLGRHGEVSAGDRRAVIVLAILPLMAAIVPTHQLTPLMLLSSLFVLALFCRQRVWLLALAMTVMTVGWDLTFAGPWITSNLNGITDSIGTLGANANSGFINLGDALPSQAVVAKIDRAHSAALWALAFIGLARRFRRRTELAMPLLAVAPIPLIMSNDYGGEMIFRIYLFGLPFVAFYAAAAFFPAQRNAVAVGPQRRWKARVATVALPAVLLMLLPGFAAGYYGKEQVNYFSRQEVEAARFLYGIAPRGSLLIGTTSDFPWAFMNFESYSYLRFALLELKNREEILKDPVGMFSDMMSPDRHHHAYLLITRSQIADVEMTGALPRGSLARIEQALLDSPRFTVIFRNPQAVVITLTRPEPAEGDRTGTASRVSSSSSATASAPADGAQPGGMCADLQGVVTQLLSAPITFGTDGSALTADSQRALTAVAAALTSCPTGTVTITGYTDSSGGDSVNVPLSASRAKSVADQLVSQGVEPGRIRWSGAGSADPVADNRSADGRARNRRVQIAVESTQAGSPAGAPQQSGQS